MPALATIASEAAKYKKASGGRNRLQSLNHAAKCFNLKVDEATVVLEGKVRRREVHVFLHRIR